MYPILACSVVSWAVILERCGHFAITSVRLAERLRVVETAWSAPGDPNLGDRAAQAAVAPYLRADDRGLGLLGAVAILSPLLGLFGTVLG